MSSEAVPPAKSTFITAHLQKFRETRNPRDLIRVVLLIVQQQRIVELLYGVFCTLFYRASAVMPVNDEVSLISVIKEKTAQVHRGSFSRAQLIERYGARFRVELLPEDFESARWESIWEEGDEFLIIGEYGEGARLALVTAERCVLNDHYKRIRGVRHIHSVQRYGISGGFLVATGDTKKFLDLWMLQDGQISFTRRLKKHLAGFTAAAEVNGGYYFGTDFSSRPNYITTLDGTKYFYPSKAYNLYVTAFYSFFGRYIVSVNNELRVVGGRKTLSVFDTVERRFIYCDFWAAENSVGSRQAA
ncbi:MAG TPA: hypothetical protein VD930_07840 [Gemmatimonadales bacterium]|nr:hypothetical protein [Gemmatimonadales bacterium]